MSDELPNQPTTNTQQPESEPQSAPPEPQEIPQETGLSGDESGHESHDDMPSGAAPDPISARLAKIDAYLEAQNAPKDEQPKQGEQTPEIAYEQTIKHFREAFDEDTAKALEPLARDLAETRRQNQLYAERLNQQEDMSILYAGVASLGGDAQQEYGSTFYTATPDQVKKAQKLFRTAVLVRQTAAANGEVVDGVTAVKEAVAILGARTKESTAMQNITNKMTQRNDARTVPAGRTPPKQTPKTDFAEGLDKDDPMFEHKVRARQRAAQIQNKPR